MTPIALQLYTVRELAEADFFAMLKTVADIGFAGVEFAGLFGRKPAEVRRVLDDLGLKTCGFHVGMPDPDAVESLMEMSEALNCNKMICPWLGPQRFASADEIRRTAAVLEATAKLLNAHGMRFLYHNHEHEMVRFNGKPGMEILLEAAPSLQAEIDTYWAAYYDVAESAALVRKFAARTPLLHIKDGTFLPGERMSMALGKGKMKIAPPIAAADRNVLEWLVVELDDCQTDMLTAVKESYQYMIDNKLGAGRK